MSGGYDKQIILWNPYQEKHIKTFKGHGYQVMDIAIAFDNGSFVSCGGDKQPFLWDVGTGVVVRKVRGHDQMINSVSFNADASVFASASYDQTTKVWDCKSRSIEPIQVMDDATDSVTAVILGESEILTSSVDGCLRTYDLRMGQLRTDHMGTPITSITVSADGNMVLLGCLDGKLRLLDRLDGTLIREFSGHVNTEFKLDSAFLNDEQLAVSGSEDGRVFYWNIGTGKTNSLQAHSRMVSGVSAHPSDSHLLTSSSDTTIKLWNLSPAPSYEKDDNSSVT